MTNYNEILDEVLDGLHETGCSVIEGMNFPRSVSAGFYECDCCVLNAKQALTSLIKELVAEAKIEELKTFTGISNEIPESEILARIKELEAEL